MQVNSDVQLKIGGAVITLLKELSGLSENQIIITLNDMCADVVAKVRNPNHKQSWAMKKVQFPGTPVQLRIKAKFQTYNRNIKLGAIVCSFDLHQGRNKVYEESDIVNLAVDTIILGANDA